MFLSPSPRHPTYPSLTLGILDFGFWILDFGFPGPPSAIQNRQSGECSNKLPHLIMAEQENLANRLALSL
jgi:hypothetical protein